MPGCDGAELGRRITQDVELKCTHLVLLTSSGQRGECKMFAYIGFAGYLMKPATQRDLIDCLMQMLAKSILTWHLKSQHTASSAVRVCAGRESYIACRGQCGESESRDAAAGKNWLLRRGGGQWARCTRRMASRALRSHLDGLPDAGARRL
jgi:DNA-binding NarL/FixJ family response regulator